MVRAWQIAVWVGLLAPLSAGAQQRSTQEEQESQADDQELAVNGNFAGVEQEIKEQPELRELNRSNQQLNRQVGELGERLGELEAKVQASTKDEEERVLEEFYAEASEQSTPERKLNIHGFFDLTFSKNFLPTGISPGPGAFKGTSSFIMSNINLYFGAELTPTLSSVVELKFSFLPNGMEYNHDIIIEETGQRVGSYTRADTRQIDPFTSQVFYANSVMIERAHLTWTPRDWFKVIVGRYLTPYGIWNVDHGSTVILTATMPFMQIRQMMPSSQLGLQVGGRVFPRDDLYLDYVLTLSNGRINDVSITSDAGDLDENKALGAGLSLTYERMGFSIKGGGYGFYGKTTDVVKSTSINMDDASFRGSEQNILDLTEMIFSGYLLLEVVGLRIQSEIIWQRSEYDTTSRLNAVHQLLMTPDPTGEDYYASAIGMGGYGLIGYQLPLDDYLGSVRIIPYFMVEHNQINDTQPFLNNLFFIGGVNIRPTSWVALKLEYAYVIPKQKEYEGDLSLLSAQLAASF